MSAPHSNDRAEDSSSSSLAIPIPGVNPQLRVVTDGLTYEVWHDQAGAEHNSPELKAHLDFGGVTDADVRAILAHRREAQEGAAESASS